MLEQQAHLTVPGPVHEREMGRHDRDGARAPMELGCNGGTALQPPEAQIQAKDARDRPAREDRVPELAILVDTRDNEGDVESELLGDAPERVWRSKGPQNLLQGNHIGIDLCNDRDGPLWLELGPTRQTRPAVHVVGRNGKLRLACARGGRYRRCAHHSQIGHRLGEKGAVPYVEILETSFSRHGLASYGHQERTSSRCAS